MALSLSDSYWDFVTTIPYLIDAMREADLAEVLSLRDELDVHWNGMSSEERIEARRYADRKLEESTYDIY